MLPPERLRRGLHRLQRPQIQLQELDLAFAGGDFAFDLLDRGVAAFLRACCEDEVLWVVFGELEDGFFA